MGKRGDTSYGKTESVGSGDRLHTEGEKPSRVLRLILLGACENASMDGNKAKQHNKQTKHDSGSRKASFSIW